MDMRKLKLGRNKGKAVLPDFKNVDTGTWCGCQSYAPAGFTP